MSIRAVVFDWGGTLTEPLNFEELTDLWTLAAKHIAPERAEEMQERLEQIEERMWNRIALDQKAFSLGDILQTASRELGVDVAEALLEEAGTHHLDVWTPHIVHDSEAAATLAALKGEGLAIGLLSNTHWPRPFHEHFLARDGLAEFIDVRCYTSEMERTKPHPASYRHVLQQLGVRAAEAVFVGDRLYDDVFGAKAVGMKAVWRRDRNVPGYDVEPDAVIDRLPELVPLVDKWLSNQN